MLTRIEIDGFKTFHDFTLNLAPLQLIIGANGAGKSNLFDAILLLSHLADSDLRTAFQKLRGDAGELFTLNQDGSRSKRIRIAVEMLVDPDVTDSWGAEAEIKYTRLRYELEIVQQADAAGLERLYVERESLAPIPRGSDPWIKEHKVKESDYWLPKITGGRPAFISTSNKQGKPTISMSQDGHGGRKSSVAERMERTVLSGAEDTNFPHAFAAREEMRHWRLLQLNPVMLREPCSMVGPQQMGSDGQYLAAMLARMKAEEPFSLHDISREMARLVPGITKIEVDPDPVREQFVIRAEMQDGRQFSSRVLSEGTLRMLALTALKHDPEHRGVLLFEEPENGVHERQLENIARIVGDLGTDFANAEEKGLPLRQFICNTHSPIFARHLEKTTIVLAYVSLLRIAGNPSPVRVTRMVPVHHDGNQLPLLKEDISQEELSYTLGAVTRFLKSSETGEIASSGKQPEQALGAGQ